MQLSIQLKSRVKEFYTLFQQGVSSIVQAGEVLVEIRKDEPDIFDAIITQYPEIKLATLELLERLGRHEVYLPVFLDESYGARKALEMPYKTQVALTKTTIPVVRKVDGGLVTEHKRLSELTRMEADIALGENGVVPVEQQQKAWREIEKEKRVRQDMRYAINGDHVIFMARSEFTASELEGILERIKNASAITLQQDMAKRQVVKG